MSNSNCSSRFRCTWLWGSILFTTCSSWWISSRFSLGLAPDSLLSCSWLDVLIVSYVATTGCLWLIGCWTLSIIVCPWTHSSSIWRLVSAAYWLRVMSGISIWLWIGCIIWVCSVVLLVAHWWLIFYLIMEVCFSVSYPWLWILYYIEILILLF